MSEVYSLMEVYHQVYHNEDVISEEDTLDIEDWLEELVSEGYDLDEYSDEELLDAYYEGLDEANRGEQRLGKKGLEPVLVRSARMAAYAGKPSTLRSDDETMRQHPRYVSGHQRGGDRSLASTNPRTEAHKAKRGVKTRGTGIREEVDLYDIISNYLVSEGFCESYEDADVIMANMSEEWRESIMEAFVSPFKAPHRQGRSINNPGTLSPAMKAMRKSDELQRTEPGSQRQKMQTRRSQQLTRVYGAARQAP